MRVAVILDLANHTLNDYLDDPDPWHPTGDRRFVSIDTSYLARQPVDPTDNSFVLLPLARPIHIPTTVSDRGFAAAPPIQAAYGGTIELRESSAASGPHLWLDTTEPVDLNGYATGANRTMKETTTLHLTAAAARELRDQLDYMLATHYQGDASLPEPGDET